jgi:very-short-patch-repair endonuclease
VWRRALLSHASAAALWDLRATASGRVEVTVPRASGFRSKGAIVVHRADRKPATHRGIPTTTPTQTLTDLSYTLPTRAVERALEQAEKLNLLNTATAGPRLRSIIDDHDFAPTRSELEAAFRRLCRRHRLPMPAVNARVHGHEVDFSWPEHRLIVETDGHHDHGTRAAFERDRARDAELIALGWRVVRFTYRQVMGRPGVVAGVIRRCLASPAGSAPARR